MSVALVVAIISNITFAPDRMKIKTRSIDIGSQKNMKNYTDSFKECKIFYDDDLKKVRLMANDKYEREDKILFNNVNLSIEKKTESDEVSLDEGQIDEEFDQEIFIEDKEDEEILDEEVFDDVQDDVSVNYECTFDMSDLIFYFDAELLDEDGEIIDTKSLKTEAIVTSNGGLDACIDLNGEKYLLSDYEQTSTVDNCSIFAVIKIVAAYLAVAELAEQVKAKLNYKYNKQLESSGRGVGKGYYIYDQTNVKTLNRKSGNYRFGFTTFKNVGCEVAAAYNTALSLNDSERLSQTIYYFEAWAIEFSHKKYTNFSKLKDDVEKRNSCRIIMSRWNSKKTNGLHTFFVKKTGKNSLYAYNWSYGSGSVKRASLNSFNDGSGFIVGYLIWK